MVCSLSGALVPLLKAYDISEMFGFSVGYGSYRI